MIRRGYQSGRSQMLSAVCWVALGISHTDMVLNASGAISFQVFGQRKERKIYTNVGTLMLIRK